MAATLLRSARLAGSKFHLLAGHSAFLVENKTLNAKSLKTTCSLFDTLKINMPSLSPTMTQGTIVKWHKNEGDLVSPGDVLCDIQTDKAVVSLDTEEEGTLAKILKPEDSTDVQVGTLIALMVEEGDDWQNVEIPADAGQTMVLASGDSSVQTLQPQQSSQPGSGHVNGPAVRALLELYDIDVSNVTASGPHNRLLKGDVLKYIKDHKLKQIPAPKAAPPAVTQPASVQSAAPQPITPAPPAPPSIPTRQHTTPAPHGTDQYSDIELTGMRRIIASRLTESKTTIPHSYASINCDVEEVSKLRKQFKEDGIRVSVNDFIIKACAEALQRVPEVNSVWSGDAPRLLEDIDISVAVATENGLITPIVKDAISLGVQEISNTVKDLATRAKSGKLALHEFQGGSFTISNLGMFGITEFSAVINPPQASILAVGASRLTLDCDANPRTVFTVTLSSDSRMVDDATASRFLEAFRDAIQNPMMALTRQSKPDLQKFLSR